MSGSKLPVNNTISFLFKKRIDASAAAFKPAGKVAKVRPGERRLIHFDRNTRPHGVLPDQDRNIKVILRKNSEIHPITVRSNSSHLDAYSGPFYTGQHVHR